MKTLGTKWFSQMNALTTIGIVLVEMNEKERRDYDIVEGNRAAYLGMGVVGNSEENDVDYIVKTGAKFPVNVAEILMGMYSATSKKGG